MHVVTPYGSGAGSSRVRVHEWLERIPDVARTYSYAGLSSSSPLVLSRYPGRVLSGEVGLRILSRRGVDRLLLHREASPLSRGGVEARLLSSALFSVYDIDDALYCDGGEGPRYRRLAPKGPKAVRAAQRADRVIVGNEVLANWASAFNSDVVIIPSCVDPAGYDRKRLYDIDGAPRLGWIGSSSTEIYLSQISDSLLRLHIDTGARLSIIGVTDRRLGALEQMIDRTKWSIDAQRRGLALFDVGIMPLIDTPYARGKCAYKLLQYMAAGLPSVASPIGVNEKVLSAAGLPAPATVRDWYGAVREMLDLAASERSEMAARGYRVVIEGYSFSAWRDTWRRAMGLIC